MDGQQSSLKLDDEARAFKIKVLEAIGRLVFAIHRNRGRLCWLATTESVVLGGQQRTNWCHLDKWVEKLEQQVWEVAPPRALLWTLTVWRRTGELEKDIRQMLVRDIYGRNPISSQDPLHEARSVKDNKEDVDLLIAALGIDDDKVFRLRVMEALGLLTLAIHKNRGRMTWLTHTEAVSFPTEAGLNNWHVLDKAVKDTESLLWEIVPPRALLSALKQWRETGSLGTGLRKIIELVEEADAHGRAAYMSNYEGRKG